MDGGVDAFALAYVDLVAQHTNISELRGGFAGPFVGVIGRAIVDDGNLELLRRVLELDQALDRVVDRAALVEQRHDDRDRRFVAGDLRIEILAAKDRQVPTEHVAVQEDDEDEEVDREIDALAKQTNQAPAAIRSRLTRDGALDRIRNRIRTEKTLDFLYHQSA